MVSGGRSPQKAPLPRPHHIESLNMKWILLLVATSLLVATCKWLDTFKVSQSSLSVLWHCFERIIGPLVCPRSYKPPWIISSSYRLLTERHRWNDWVYCCKSHCNIPFYRYCFEHQLQWMGFQQCRRCNGRNVYHSREYYRILIHLRYSSWYWRA